MRKGPELFSDFGKIAKDLLARGYSDDQKFTVSTVSDTGVALTSTIVKKGRVSTGNVAVVYKYNNIVVNVQVNTASVISTILTVTDILPSTKTVASFKVPYNNSGMTLEKLELHYFHHHATFITRVALNHSPVIDVSATIGTPSVAFGGEACYDTSSRTFTKYTAGITVTKPELYSSGAILLADKGDTIRALYEHHFNKLRRIGVVGEITRRLSTNKNTFTLGTSFLVNHLTVVKAKLDNYGKLRALVQHEFMPKSLMTISGEVETKALQKTPRFGLAIALKLGQSKKSQPTGRARARH